MERVYISKIDLGFCYLKITGDDRAVLEISRENSDFSVEENEITALAAKEIGEYLIHIRTEFSFPMEYRGTPFRRQVWDALRQIPFGQTVSYGELAAAIGKPKAARAVGQAVGSNPFLIVVPCHRVLGKDGSLTGFSAGMDLKKFLLELEGIGWR